jgi:redox-sensitive bicupin YhaK (pirin superfamily)
VALPLDEEECAPRFDHHPGATIPRTTRNGAALSVVAGTAYGFTSPVPTFTPTLYVHAELPGNATLEIDDAHEERAAYVVAGSVTCADTPYDAGNMIVFAPGARARVTANDRATLMLVGGARLSGTRHIEWNFVSSSVERIARAKDDWRNRRFPAIPGDDDEFIPLPDE